jgi:membrane protein implicated in regulation of membrane protease activity
MCSLHTVRVIRGDPARGFCPFLGGNSLFGAYASAVDAWVWWLIAAIALAILEALTLTFVLGITAIAAGASAIAAAAGASSTWQWVIFAICDAVLLTLLLPVARRHRHMPPRIRSGTDKLVGTRAMSLSEITTATGGQVRIGGETWTARPYQDGVAIPAGQWVDVMAIDGVTAVVNPSTVPSDT